MRVIAGDFRGRRLKSVPGTQTRPTSDKVKEAAFHIMGPFFDGGVCLDLFAGSGSLGIEAISRGFDFAVFIDNNRKAIHTVSENIKLLKIEEQTEVSRMDAFRALRVTAKNKSQFNLILIDPPYSRTDYQEILNEIIQLNLLANNGLVYCEHDTSQDLPPTIEKLEVIKTVTYGGTTAITIYQMK